MWNNLTCAHSSVLHTIRSATLPQYPVWEIFIIKCLLKKVDMEKQIADSDESSLAGVATRDTSKL